MAAPKDGDGKFDHSLAPTGVGLIKFLNDDRFKYLTGFRLTPADTIDYQTGEMFNKVISRFRSGYTLLDVLEVAEALRLNTLSFIRQRPGKAHQIQAL